MRKGWLFILLLTCTLMLNAQGLPKSVISAIDKQTKMAEGFHIVNINNKDYSILITDSNVISIRRQVIPFILIRSEDSLLFEMIEEAYAAFLLKIDNPRFDNISVTDGDWLMLEQIGDELDYNIKRINNFYVTLSLVSNGRTLELQFPIDYQKFHSGSRSEIEKSFIDGLSRFNKRRARMLPDYTIDQLKKVGDNIYVLPGEQYLTNSINENSYLSKNTDSSFDYIVNPKQPVATISNMIVLGIGYTANLNMTISRHEYGESTILNIPLEVFLQYCVSEGCRIFWGFDSLKDDILKGTIFCNNSLQGYEHIIRVKCAPSHLGEKDFVMNGRVSLFVPTTNVVSNY